jgi:hypothetical protein
MLLSLNCEEYLTVSASPRVMLDAKPSEEVHTPRVGSSQNFRLRARPRLTHLTPSLRTGACAKLATVAGNEFRCMPIWLPPRTI